MILSVCYVYKYRPNALIFQGIVLETVAINWSKLPVSDIDILTCEVFPMSVLLVSANVIELFTHEPKIVPARILLPLVTA